MCSLSCCCIDNSLYQWSHQHAGLGETTWWSNNEATSILTVFWFSLDLRWCNVQSLIFVILKVVHKVVRWLISVEFGQLFYLFEQPLVNLAPTHSTYFRKLSCKLLSKNGFITTEYLAFWVPWYTVDKHAKNKQAFDTVSL